MVWLVDMGKNKKKRIDIVYSTEDSFEYDYEEEFEEQTLNPSDQNLKVFIDRKSRKGKTVILVSGFIGQQEDLKELSKQIKTKIGVGGSAKDGEIIIQTEDREKVCTILSNLNYKFKKSGN